MKLVDKIIDYEAGDLDEDETIELFQELVDSGLAWTLQGSYGRTAVALIEAGLVTREPPADPYAYAERTLGAECAE